VCVCVCVCVCVTCFSNVSRLTLLENKNHATPVVMPAFKLETKPYERTQARPIFASLWRRGSFSPSSSFLGKALAHRSRKVNLLVGMSSPLTLSSDRGESSSREGVP